jgi:hypothetical protein
LFYHPTFQGELPLVPGKPTREEMLRARNWILDDLIHDFPFDKKINDEAYVLALLFQPFIRSMITGFCPFFLIDKPQAGTGASLLAQSIINIVTGGDTTAASSMDLSGGDYEVGKKLLSTFSTAPSVIFIDNIVGELSSKRLTETLTSHYYSDRVLGESRMAHYPIRNLWIGTGNNPKMSADMVRRTIRIRLDANMARPEYRTGFKHANLETWVANNIPNLLWACLTMIQYWISNGKPLAPVTKGGGFESWSQTMGGICNLLELDAPFLSNEREMHLHLDDETLSWSMLCEAWWATHKGSLISSNAVGDIIKNTESDVNVVHSNNDAGWASNVGRALSARKDKMFGVFIIKAGQPFNNAKRWYLTKWEVKEPEG